MDTIAIVAVEVDAVEVDAVGLNNKWSSVRAVVLYIFGDNAPITL